jgi:ABC-type Fe2+-enterobactin transport system substrate-binding protein
MEVSSRLNARAQVLLSRNLASRVTSLTNLTIAIVIRNVINLESRSGTNFESRNATVAILVTVTIIVIATVTMIGIMTAILIVIIAVEITTIAAVIEAEDVMEKSMTVTEKHSVLRMKLRHKEVDRIVLLMEEALAEASAVEVDGAVEEEDVVEVAVVFTTVEEEEVNSIVMGRCWERCLICFPVMVWKLPICEPTLRK